MVYPLNIIGKGAVKDAYIFDTYRRLLGEEATGPSLSVFFVSHYMFFKKKWVKELKKIIEARHHTNWYTAIINSVDKNEWDSFSEYETYKLKGTCRKIQNTLGFIP